MQQESLMSPWQRIKCKKKFKINKCLVPVHSNNIYTVCTKIFWIVPVIKTVNINKEQLFWLTHTSLQKLQPLIFMSKHIGAYLVRHFLPPKLFHYLMPASRVLSLIRFIKKIRSNSLTSVEKKKSWSFRYSEMGLINHWIDESLNPNFLLKTKRQNYSHMSGHVFSRILALYHVFLLTVFLVV